MTTLFLGMGGHRTGCPWLRRQLAAHPEVALARAPDGDELHYFDSTHPNRSGVSYGARIVRAVRQHVKAGRRERAKALLDQLDIVFGGPAAYRRHLAALEAPGMRAVGDLTAGYALLGEEAFTAMRATLAEPKVFVLLRDPIERYWSALHHQEPGRAVRRFTRNRPVDPSQLAQSDYENLVPSLDRVFGADVLYLFFEELFSAESLERIARHLDIATEWPWELSVPGEVGAATMPAPTETVLAQFAPQYAYMRERFGTGLPSSWCTGAAAEGRLP